MSLLEVQGLTKVYRRRRSDPPLTAADGVAFDLDRGMTLAVVGESGAGKSTVARMALRLIEPTSGTVRFDGTDMLALPRRQMRLRRRRMQMIFQDPFNSLDPRMSIGRAVAEPLKVHFGMNRPERQEKAIELLSRVGLGRHHAHRYPQEMSGGQLQRVAIARALAVDPDLLVCDEPVAALDVSVRAQVLNLLLDLQEERDIACLFITHDLSTIEVFAHHVLVMRQGKVVEHGTTTETFARPRHPYTVQLMSAIPGQSRPQSPPGPPQIRPGATEPAPTERLHSTPETEGRQR